MRPEPAGESSRTVAVGAAVRRHRRGRDAFSSYRSVLRSLAAVLRLLPAGISQWLWNRVSGMEGRIGIGLRYSIAARMAQHVGDSVNFGRNVTVKYWQNLSVGDHVSIHDGCYLDALGGVRIGNNVSIAHSCSVMTYDHGWADEKLPIRDNPLELKAVEIADDVWLGCGVRVMKGVTLGPRTVVGAGAVVTRSFPHGFAVIAGVPARKLKSLNQSG